MIREKHPPRAPLAHALLVALGALYLAGVWLEGVGSGIPAAILPRTPLYFLQIAALFPRASVNVIDYRAEGWLCGERRWQELDMRAYFPLDPDDKENRFQRLMHFLRDNRATMQALDEFVIRGHAERAGSDGIPEATELGGIRVLSLRLPIPEPPGGSAPPLVRAERHPLSEYPKTVRKHFYYTPQSKRSERCGYHDARPSPSAHEPGEAPDSSEHGERLGPTPELPPDLVPGKTAPE